METVFCKLKCVSLQPSESYMQQKVLNVFFLHILISFWYLRFSWVRRKVLPLRRSDQHELYRYSLYVFPMSILGLLNDETPYPRPLREVHLDPVIRWTMRVSTPPALVFFICYSINEINPFLMIEQHTS